MPQESKKGFIDYLKNINYEKYGSLIALIVLFIIAGIANPIFFRPLNIMNILRQISYVGTIALGMTFVIISGGIDLSVGSMMALIGGIMIIVINQFGGNVLAIILAIIFGAALSVGLGLGTGLIVTKGKIAPFIATLGTMAIYRSLVLYFANGGEYRSISSIYPKIGGGKIPLGDSFFIPTPVIIFFVYAILCHIILEKTRFGRYVYAIGSNESAAIYSAIKVDRVKIITYIIVAFSVFLTSLMLSSRMNSVSSTSAGLGFELDAIAAVVIGGTSMKGGRGWIWGTVFGAIILGIINNMLNLLNVSPYLQGAVKGLVIIGAVLIQRKRT
ncbi:MAG: ribose transport system permease protein [Thermotogaceae bacterium]|jgi:ribose transport system permease protein|nr:ribose transport system permease protein [Thermotogaceae bacterium]MDN5338663.1 ribose transport system permease protein [Thermotogaceae bacterium]